MIGVKKISVYHPVDGVDNFALAAKHDTSAKFLEDKIGMTRLSRRDVRSETSDLAAAAALPLFEKYGLSLDTVDCLVLVTQNPDGAGLPHCSAKVHQLLGLRKNCAVFDISLGCSGYVQALSVIKAFMESQGFKNGLLVTSDPYSKIVDMGDRVTSMIFGDGATATWMSEAPGWKIGACDFGVRSEDSGALEVGESGKLYMNGRAVFNFAAVEVPQSIERVLRQSKMTMDEIDQVLLHQGSKYMVETIAKRIGGEGKTPFAAALYGNTVSSSIPMLLAENVPASARKLLLSGFGVGLAWATCLLERI